MSLRNEQISFRQAVVDALATYPNLTFNLASYRNARRMFRALEQSRALTTFERRQSVQSALLVVPRVITRYDEQLETGIDPSKLARLAAVSATINQSRNS